MTTAASIMASCSRWACKLMTVKQLISNNASQQLVAVREKWESNGVVVRRSPPSCSSLLLSFYHLWNPRSKKKKKSRVILSFTIHFIWRLTNSIRMILCALHGCCRGAKGGGLPGWVGWGVGGQAPNTNKRARLCLLCPARWEGKGAE